MLFLKYGHPFPLHSLLNLLKLHTISSSLLNISEKYSIADSIARKKFLLQHLGPPCSAIIDKLLAVIMFDSFHSSFAKGLLSLIRLINIPTPTAAPQFPWEPQNPPKILSALFLAFLIFDPFLRLRTVSSPLCRLHRYIEN